MEQITPAMVLQAAERLKGQLIDHQAAMDLAYIKDELNLSVNLSLKFSPAPDIQAGIKIETGVTFVESKIKDRRVLYVDPNQLTLFKEEKE